MTCRSNVKMKPIKTMKALALEVAKREGLKKSISIAQIKEVLGIVSDLCIKNEGEVLILLAESGKRRAKRRKK